MPSPRYGSAYDEQATPAVLNRRATTGELVYADQIRTGEGRAAPVVTLNEWFGVPAHSIPASPSAVIVNAVTAAVIAQASMVRSIVAPPDRVGTWTTTGSCHRVRADLLPGSCSSFTIKVTS